VIAFLSLNRDDYDIYGKVRGAFSTALNLYINLKKWAKRLCKSMLRISPFIENMNVLLNEPRCTNGKMEPSENESRKRYGEWGSSSIRLVAVKG